MFEKILFPTDFSDVSLHTLYNCIPEFSRMGAKEIVIIHIVERSVSVEKKEAKAIKRLEEITKELKEVGANVSYLVEPLGPIRRNAAEIICNRAYTQEADLVVIPTKGANILMETLIGSVAKNVVRMCEVPLLLLRHRWDKKKKEPRTKVDYGETFNRPLIALDFSTCSERALDTVKKVEDIVKEAILYHVVDYGRPEDTDDNVKEAKHMLDKYAKAFSIPVNSKVGGGEASDGIMRASEDLQASLIMVSKTGGGMVQEFLVGSITNSVTRRSSKPVLVVPCHEVKKVRKRKKEKKVRKWQEEEEAMPQVY
ncbi:MAG: universal stress protein [Archaeoglobaceae archaeon]